MSDQVAVLERLTRLARVLSRAAVWVGGALTLASVLLITFEVVSRRLFGFSMGGADELSGYAFAISITWAFAFTVLERANVRIDVLYQHLPVRVTAFLDWLSLVALGVFAVYLSYYGTLVALTSWEQSSAANTPLATPLWIPQFLWAAGLVWFVIVLLLMLLRSSAALVTGDLELVKTLAGMKTASEEADEGAAEGERLIQAEQR
ncbi:MAG TPA: TRAP transporter small permease [Burkholderiaceae bacterium]|nr:TRAP transporter small permease [Burkholderiaceae bacterium]